MTKSKLPKAVADWVDSLDERDKSDSTLNRTDLPEAVTFLLSLKDGRKRLQSVFKNGYTLDNGEQEEIGYAREMTYEECEEAGIDYLGIPGDNRSEVGDDDYQIVTEWDYPTTRSRFDESGFFSVYGGNTIYSDIGQLEGIEEEGVTIYITTYNKHEYNLE